MLAPGSPVSWVCLDAVNFNDECELDVALEEDWRERERERESVCVVNLTSL